jgi:threonylcarbamoyladenosine tRNA methylthiotransferase MtaB
VYTLGCKVNQADSLSIARMLAERGFTRVEFSQGADVYVIDTCTVTHEAARRAARLRRGPRASIPTRWSP